MMQADTLSQINERLEKLPPDRLRVVYDFVSYLVDREQKGLDLDTDANALQTMLASEEVLRRDWDRPEEDEALAHL